MTTACPVLRAYTRPLPSTPATASSLEENESAASRTTSPSSPVAVTRTVALVPVTMVASGRDASSAATGRARTTTATKLITLPERAAMRASPGDTAVTWPLWSTAATSGVIAIQRTGASARTVPDSS